MNGPAVGTDGGVAGKTPRPISVLWQRFQLDPGAAIRKDVQRGACGSAAKLGPFEEFARRTKYCTIKLHEASPLQTVWDQRFVLPYWGDGDKPGYLQHVKESLAKCDDSICAKAVAQEVRRLYDDFYQGYCSHEKPVKQLPEVWSNRELRRIAIQEPPAENLYQLGAQ